jgi:hypothetical protein
MWHYEIKQFGHDQFQPNIFVDVSEPSRLAQSGYEQHLDNDDTPYREFLEERGWDDTCAHAKVYLLWTCMKTQKDKPFLHPELLLGLMRVRATQACPRVEYAEAFQGRAIL